MTDLNFTVTYVSFAFSRSYQPGKTLAMRSRPAAGLTLVLSGRLRLTYEDGRSVSAGENEIILQRRGDHYRLEVVGEEEAKYIVISYTAEPEERMSGILPRGVVSVDHARRLREEFKRAADTFTRRDACHEPMLRAIVQQILCSIIKSQSLTALDRENDRATAAQKYINDSFERKISSADIAAAVGLSESHLRTVFKAAFGISPMNYLNTVRVEQAKRMLDSGIFSLSEIAAACGFANVYYFSTVFKSLTGTPPGKY